VDSRTSTRWSSPTSRATTSSIASVSPVTQSAEITCGIARTASAGAVPALAALPVAALAGGAPSAPHALGPVLAVAALGPVLAVAALGLAGTLLPFALFAYGQAHVPAELAGAFVNLEPLVGAAAGAVAVVASIALSTLPRPVRPSGRPALFAG
jgi:drug/metabolite transporter (DMT)-like permease